MSLTKQFERKLDELWRRRIANIHSLVRRRCGRRKTFSRKHREHGIRQLQQMATIILSREGARDELAEITVFRRQRRVRGRGLSERYQRLIDWADEHLTGPIIYSFWRGKRCLYVGKGTSWHRLKSYRKSVYLKEATNLKVRGIRSRSVLAKAECLATHLFHPRDNAVKAARGKWSKSCPICSTHKMIRTELRALFSLK